MCKIVFFLFLLLQLGLSNNIFFITVTKENFKKVEFLFITIELIIAFSPKICIIEENP